MVDYWRLLVPERDDIMDKEKFNSQASGSDMGMAWNEVTHYRYRKLLKCNYHTSSSEKLIWLRTHLEVGEPAV